MPVPVDPERQRRVEELYHDALSRPHGEREAFVAKACQGDEELRREVRDLLAHHSDAKRLFEEPVAEVATRPLAALPGTRLGPYEIVEPIGAGGMGEVYRATDTRLDRTVAVKVLPVELTRDREALQRFEREARAISRLAHPHICTLFDVGREAGTDFLVMEHLEGQPLAERLTRGALPLDQALELGAQIADALGVAHRQGVVHRDLKPGNIVITRSGAKLLDFGIAKLNPVHPTSSRRSDPPAGTDLLTRPGLLMGTLPYMAPEQLHGDEADARTDIFNLGAVVYEMVTGRRAFEGTGQAGLIATILERDPAALSELTREAPPHLDRVVRRCLAQDPDDRWQSADDVAAELRWIAEGLAQATQDMRSLRERSLRPRPWVWGVAAVTALAGLGLPRFRSRAPGDTRPVTRTSIDLPPGHSLAIANHRSALALSPSGSHLAYLAAPEGARRQIYVRALDSFQADPLPGTEDADDLFFSADGRWIGFFVDDRKIKKVPVTGGAVVTVCSAPGADGASWGPDDTIIFPARARGLRRVSASGGPVEVLTVPDEAGGERFHAFPHVLPDGRVFLYALQTADSTSADDRRIVLRSLETGEQKTLITGGTNPRYLPSGHIVYSRAGSLWAVRFDIETLTVSGPSVRVLDGVRTYRLSGDPTFAVARNGTLVYVPGGTETGSRLLWVDRSGTPSPVTEETRGYFDVAVSPDGRRLAATIGWTNHHVWIYDLSRETLSRLTDEFDQHGLAWAPDGKRVLFSSNASEPQNIFWKAVGGGGRPERVLTAAGRQHPTSVSPDGVLAFEQTSPSTGRDIWTYPLDGGSAPRAFVATEFDEGRPRFSPDGRWIAYQSDRTGRWEIYVAAFPGPGETVLVSRDGGAMPRWAPSGRELFYRSGDTMMTVEIEVTPRLTAGRPRALFTGSYEGPYDVSPDGRRFVMIQKPELEVADVTRLNVVFNWTRELEARMLDAE